MSKALELSKLSNKSNLKGSGASFEARNCFERQSFTKYLRQTLVLCEIAHYGKSSVSVFQKIFTSTDRIFISGRGPGTRQEFYAVSRFS